MRGALVVLGNGGGVLTDSMETSSPDPVSAPLPPTMPTRPRAALGANEARHIGTKVFHRSNDLELGARAL